MRMTSIARALSVLLAAPAFADTMPTTAPSNTTVAPSTALTQAEVESRVAMAGFKEVKSLTFKNGI